MGYLTWLRDRVRSGLVPQGGTLSVPGDSDGFPIAISNELMGGSHGYRTLDELASIPTKRLTWPMQAIVRQHDLGGGDIFPRTTMVLDPNEDDWNLLLTYDRLIDIPGYDISRYWKALDTGSPSNLDAEVQYAAPQDYGTGPSIPAFQPPVISAPNYQNGYKSDADNTVIWSDTYDSTVHIYMRQRLGSAGKWGIPVKFNGESYEQGDYIDNRFIWVLKGIVPSKPQSLVDGLKNNEPIDWTGTPDVPGGADYYVYASTHDLYKISATKDTYQNLKSEWSTPYLVSTDPLLVRYGNKPSSQDYLGVGNTDTADWRGYYTPKLDTHMAVRENTLSPWKIYNIDNEEGEYVDYIFKSWSVGYEVTDADRPTISNPFSSDIAEYPNNGWSDSPFDPGLAKILYMSSGRKYNNGDLKPSGWSIPIPANGEDVIQVIIEEQTAKTFKYASDLTVTPSEIIVKAKFYRGSDTISSGFTIKWFKGAYDSFDLSNEIIPGSVVGVSANHVISGTNNEILTISPAAVDNLQVYTVRVFFEGDDYLDTIDILDVSDAQGFLVVIDSDSGFVFKNQSGTYTFTGILYNNGIEVPFSQLTFEWLLGGLDITPLANKHIVTVTGSDFNSKETLKLNITYDGVIYTRTESLVDIQDANAVLFQYSDLEAVPDGATVWSTSPTNAVWARNSVDGGVTWSDAFRVKGESAPFNGGLYRNAYKNSIASPAVSGTTFDLLPTGGDWTDAPTTPGVDEFVWQSVALFMKNPANNDTGLTTDNWIIDGTWSTPLKIGPIPSGGGGTPGADGAVGWTASYDVTSFVFGGSLKSYMRLNDYINNGGADPLTKPTYGIGYFLGPTGLVTNPASATNIMGATGPSGVFNASDFWNGSTVRINGNLGSPYYTSHDVKFRVSKAGVVYFSGKVFKNTGGAYIVDYTLPTQWINYMQPAAAQFAAGAGVETHAVLGWLHFKTSINGNSAGDNVCCIVQVAGVWKLRLRFIGDQWTTVFNGSYPTNIAFV